MSDNYDQDAAQDAGYAAGAVGKLYTIRLALALAFLAFTKLRLIEGDYNRADQEVQRDEQRVEDAPENAARDAEQGFDNTVQGVENVPSDIGSGIKDAASW
jgi:hypothetical protein